MNETLWGTGNQAILIPFHDDFEINFETCEHTWFSNMDYETLSLYVLSVIVSVRRRVIERVNIKMSKCGRRWESILRHRNWVSQATRERIYVYKKKSINIPLFLYHRRAIFKSSLHTSQSHHNLVLLFFLHFSLIKHNWTNIFSSSQRRIKKPHSSSRCVRLHLMRD